VRTPRRKPGSTWGALTSAILQAVEECGPMTSAELCDHLDASYESVRSVIARLRKTTAECPQRLYICGWVYDHEGTRDYPRAQYALGAEPDKRHNRRTSVRQRRASLTSAKEDRLRMASVFHLGMTRDELRERTRQIREMYGEAA
jgi:hypothetical protein